MAYDEAIDARVGGLIASWGLTRKTMFGGTAYLLNGNMLCGVNRHLVILRAGKDASRGIVDHPSIEPFDMTGRQMAGWFQVTAEDVDDRTLFGFLTGCRSFAESLPPKPAS